MKILNSLTGKLEKFKPIHNKKVAIYVCGITPYDTTHLGHAFTYISFDTLIRYLKFKGYKVSYTQNVTDINDRDKDILERAKKLNVPWNKLADYWTQRFLTDMAALNWVFPNHYLKASKQIPQVIELIRKLLKKGLAYQVNGSVYLDILKISDYGKLSRYNKTKMLKVAPDFEEDIDCPEKRNPLDITLWRRTLASHIGSGNVDHIPAFPSPFGPGRPGWHIECSAMSTSTLGDQIDIHGGGKDLKFPHHEAEIAQSEGATGKTPFAKYWLHTGVVYYQGQKMSKSKGNLVMVSELLKKYSCNAIRWLLLSHRWNETWEFTEEKLIKAQRKVDLVETAIKQIKKKISKTNLAAFFQIMEYNLNTPKALNLILKLAKEKNPSIEALYPLLGFRI